MKTLRYSALLLFAFAFLQNSASAQTQWTPVAKGFNGQIYIVKFLDTTLGLTSTTLPNIGFVADDTGLWQTTNYGANWTKCTITSIPNPQNPLGPFPLGAVPTGHVTDITFEADGIHGFACVTNTGVPGDSGILVTTNSGATWTFDDNPGTPDSGRGIYYNSANGRLFVSSPNSGLVYSSDGGTTWKSIDSGKHYTGFAFNGNGVGIVATEGSICNQPQDNYFWRYTADGGKTWNQSRMFYQSWQPVGIPMTQTFFAATQEYFCQTNELVVSYNGGAGFTPVFGYHGTGDTLSEAMAGDGCGLFAGSSDSANIMWASENEGANWVTLASGPPNATGPKLPPDTRFYVSPTTIWSFDQNILSYTARPPSPAIHVWPDTIHFTDAACGTTSDTIIHVFGCNCSNNPEITGDSIHRISTDRSATIHAVTVPPIPPGVISLCNSGIPSVDSVEIQYSPTLNFSDTADAYLLFSENGTVLDTPMYITGNGVADTLQPPNIKSLYVQLPACGQYDTTINYCNTSCSKITVLGIDPNSISNCPCQLTITGGSNATLLPGECYGVEIHYDAGLSVTNCGLDLVVDWQSQSGGGTHQTYPIPINTSTSTNLSPTYRGINITAKSCCSLNSDGLDSVYLFNTTCDTLTVLQEPQIVGNSKNVTEDTMYPYVPVTLPPSSNGVFSHILDVIAVNCTGTDIKDSVKFTYSVASNSPSGSVNCSQYATGTINVPVTINVGSKSTPAAVAPGSLNFGTVGCCDTDGFTRTFTITNGCDPDTITNISIGGAGASHYSFEPPLTFPIDLAANQQMQFTVVYHTLCNGTNGETDKGTVTITDKAATPNFSVTLLATSTNLAASSPSADSLDIGSILECGQDTNTVTLKNTSCGSITLKVLSGPTRSCFTLPNFPSNPIAEGDSVTVQVSLNPSACGTTGPISDMVIIQNANTSGQPGTSDTIFLAANILPPIPGVIVSSIPSATICDSSSIGETFTVTDTGTCYVYDILSGNGGNGQVIVTPSSPETSFPVHLDSGQTETFSVTFHANTIGNITGPLVLTDSDGTTISVPYNFTDTACNVVPPTTMVTISPDTIVVPNCTNGFAIVHLTVTGGLGTVNTIAVNGSDRFTLTSSSGGPMPFTDTIVFDPNVTDLNTAKLHLNYTVNGATTDTMISLFGQVNGVKDSARIGVVPVTAGCITPDNVTRDTMAIVTRDTIGNQPDLTTLTLLLAYNGNLLFSPTLFDFAPGWSLGSETETTSGLQITLDYNQGSNTAGITPAGTTIVEISQLGAISSSVTSTALAANVHFNDSAFEACTMKAMPSIGDSANICIDTASCGGRILQPAVAGNLQQIVNRFVIVPNPVHKDGSTATVHFTTAQDGIVTVEILDQLGRTTAVLSDAQLQSGDHDLSIPTDRMSEGSYFARVSINGVTIIRQFILEKE